MPTEGEIHVGGNKLAQPITDVGIVFQDHLLLDFRTALDNITAAAPGPRAAARRRAVPMRWR